jgi:thiamine biosynthesis protein ThiS
MQVTANGKEIELPEGATVHDLIERLGFGPRMVVVERNGVPLRRGDDAGERLADGDVLEVVRPMQGGQE